jgi:phosphonate transport system substrate-binding protein
MKSVFFLSSVLLGVTVVLPSCNGLSSKKKGYEPSYSPAPHSKKMLLLGVPNQPYYEITSPLVKYLNQHLKTTQIQIVASPSLNDYLDKLDQQYFDFTLIHGVKALECARNGYTIIGKGSDDDSYRGAILVNKDSAVNNFSDLKGRTIAVPSTKALAGTMMPLLFLHQHGVDVNNDLKFIYLESFESVIMNIYLGKCSAGACWVKSWEAFVKRRPELADKIMLKWVTPPLVQNAIIFKNDMAPETAKELKQLLLHIHDTEEGRNALKVIGFDQFVGADSNTYEPVKKFMKEYTRAIH